jgi:hypothetical protein
MNRIDETMNPTGPEGQLDRLVDGELNETDRRELLLQFEREPEGWRRCALAFLEAQCWKQELGVMARSPEAGTAKSPASMPVPASDRRAPSNWRYSWRQNLATALTLGACFLIALALGLSLRGNWAGGLHPGATALPATAPLPPNNPQPTLVAQPADELVTIDAANGQTESLRIPRARPDAFGQNVAEQGPDAIPPAVEQAFQRAGHEVVQQREIVPVQMNNGRRMMVPVDHVQIHYVGRGSL